MRYGLRALATAAAAALVVGACGGAEEVEGTTWAATSIQADPVIEGTFPSIEFVTGSEMSGSTGCNGYMRSYSIDGEGITILVGGVTQRACPPPVMDQEQRFLAALDQAATVDVSGSQMELRDGGGATVASFSEVSQDLAGTTWSVLSYNNGRGAVTSVIIGTELTAAFDGDDQVAGSSGCNQYTGSYEAGDGEISLGPFAVTERFCMEPDGIMQQEQEFLAALETATSYRVTADGMALRGGGDELVATLVRSA